MFSRYLRKTGRFDRDLIENEVDGKPKVTHRESLIRLQVRNKGPGLIAERQLRKQVQVNSMALIAAAESTEEEDKEKKKKLIVTLST